MSLKWLHENLLKSKDLREFGQNKFDYKNESVVPRQMRNSLCSVDVCEVSPSASVEAVNGDETLKNVSDDEDLFEIARSCPEDCLHRDCPFQSRLLSSSEVFYTVDSRYTQSSVSLVRKVSSMSFLEVSSHFDDNEFLRISRVVPVRNSSVIIHWNVKSTIGIRGYKVSYSV